MKLTKEEMYDAFRSGVKEAILEIVPDYDSSKGFFEAVEQGVSNAIWKIATNATDMPCNDFYDSIKEGVEKAHQKMNCNDD